MAEFKDIFLELRKSKNYTQIDIAKVLGVSSSTVAMWETGKRTPTRAKYEAISDIFNVDIEYLYGKTELKRKVMYDEFGNKYTSAPALSPEGYQIGLAYDNADYITKRMVERSLGLESEKEKEEESCTG